MGRLHTFHGRFRGEHERVARRPGLRGTSRTAATAAVTVAAVLMGLMGPVGPAAAVTTAAPTVTIVPEGGALTAAPAVKFTLTALNATGKTGTVQAKLAGEWADVSVPQPVDTPSWAKSVEYKFQSEGALEFRAVLKSADAVAVLSETSTVTYKAAAPTGPPAPVAAPVVAPVAAAPAVVVPPVPAVLPLPAIRLIPGAPTEGVEPVRQITLSGEDLTGSLIDIQRRYADGWKTLWMPPAPSKNSPVAYTFKFDAEGKAPLRAIATRNGKRLATSATLNLVYKRKATTATTVSSLAYGPGLFATAQGAVGSGDRASHTYQLTGSLGARQGVLQRLEGSTWVTVQNATFTQSTGYKATFTTPAVSGKASWRYRVQVAASAQEKAWTSASTVIKTVDPNLYTGYTKAAYNYMKPYCKNPVIKIISGYWSYTSVPSYHIDLSNELGTGKVMQYIALHECAHIVSFKLYENDRTFGARMDAIYGSFPRGVEALADCMAFAMGADANSNGSYTRNCSGYRGTAARMILAGQKP